MKRPTAERLEEIRAYVRNGEWNEDGTLFAEIAALRAELEEQCRLNGMGAQRELRLITERDRLAEECDQWSDRNLELVVERDRLRELLGEAIRVIGDADNGPPPFYAELFEKLEAGLK